ncbi:hypothetical protein K449DRAFT_440608 [Hypoxylon sp. EC38]|nr:hypothetical protein K449DRAFT_440608 [Hypoxylon sp. EC38]
MSLLDLPPELLRLVIEESMPEGFQSLLLSCRPIYECGKPLIALHHTRKQSWRRLRFNRKLDYMPTFSWLLKVADEPVLPRYIQEADLDSGQTHYPQQFDTLQWDDGAMDRIKEFIEDSPYLRKAEGVDPKTWAVDILFKNVDSFERYWALMMALFLTLLPNVKTLFLPANLDYFIEPPETGTQDLDFHEEVWNVMETIRQTAQENLEDASLGKLTDLNVLGSSMPDAEFNLRALSSFLIMPNLTTLSLDNCVATIDEPIGLGYRWHYPDINSGLRHINFNHACMDSDSVSQLLSHTPRLVSFAYSHASKSEYLQLDWDAGAFIATVGKYVGSHLEVLNITLKGHRGEIITGVTSMKEFTKLSSLTIETRVFCGPPIESGERKGSEYTHPTEGFIPWTIESVPHLVPMLPSSLEYLDVITSPERDRDEPEIVKRLFMDFTVDRPRLLPNLSGLYVTNYRDNPVAEDLNLIRAYVEPAGAVYRFY